MIGDEKRNMRSERKQGMRNKEKKGKEEGRKGEITEEMRTPWINGKDR